MGMYLDAGAHPGPMGELKSPRAARLPLPTTSPSGGRVWRCTHGWLLPCLLNYCSAGPWVAAAAPPRSFFSFFIFVWLGGGGALRLVCQAQEYSPGTVGHYNKTKNKNYKQYINNTMHTHGSFRLDNVVFSPFLVPSYGRGKIDLSMSNVFCHETTPYGSSRAIY